MPTTELQPAITTLLAVDIELHHSRALLNRATHLAVETGHPVYNCLYLALATDTGAALATADRRLRQTAHDLGVELWGPRPSSARQYAVTRFVVMIAARDPFVDFTSSGEYHGDIRVESDDQCALRITRGIFLVTRSAEVVLGEHFICATSPCRFIIPSLAARRLPRSPNGWHRRALSSARADAKATSTVTNLLFVEW